MSLSQLWKSLFLFSSFILLSLEVSSAPRVREDDIIGRIQILEKAIAAHPSFLLQEIDSFEGEIPWKIFRGDSFLNSTEFVAETPKLQKGFSEEWDYYSKTFSLSNRTSLMIHSHFEGGPPFQAEIKPHSKILIRRGRPMRIFFWVYSQNINMSLRLVLSQRGNVDQRIDLGELNFLGWKRIEKQIVLNDRTFKILESKQTPISVKALELKGGPYLKPGAFFLYIDQMFVLLETSVLNYSGSEISDTWGEQ